MLWHYWVITLNSDEIYDYISREPSGFLSNEPVFDHKGRPHNALVNSGCLMVCALLIYHNKKFPDVIQLFEKATTTKDTIVDYETAHELKN